jgi:hypothetical protein
MDAPEAHERFLVPHIFRPWAEEVLRRAGGLEGRSILDVATGARASAPDWPPPQPGRAVA